MKKIKVILIILILTGLGCYYHEELIRFTSQLPFVHHEEEEVQYPDKSGYEYYFKPYQNNYIE